MKQELAGLTNKRLKKSWTSSVVDGPPMFMNTIAVGPLELVAFCETGGTTVARDLNWCRKGAAFHLNGVDRELKAGVITEAALDSWHLECRSAIATVLKRDDCLLL
jgi:hypothetical protein